MAQTYRGGNQSFWLHSWKTNKSIHLGGSPTPLEDLYLHMLCPLQMLTSEDCQKYCKHIIVVLWAIFLVIVQRKLIVALLDIQTKKEERIL